MTRLQCAAQHVYDWLVGLLPRDFRHRYGVEMHMDFSEQASACLTSSGLAGTAGRAYLDLVVSALREWHARDAMRVLAYAGLGHLCLWLTVVGVSAWQWPHGPSPLRLVLQFAMASAVGIAVTVRCQRTDGYCPQRPAELD